MWREKEFWPKHSQSHPPPFLIIPRLFAVVTATINEQKSKQNGLIHYNSHLCSKTICNKTEQNVLSFQSLTFEHLGSIYLLI